MSKKTIIFTGLSISHEKALNILNAEYRAPIKRGDILKAINESPEIIGIIDGVFHHAPAVGHKEIIQAIDKGITVVGGGSMGALRASELDSLGMIGIGYVYESYASGKIESDDDVAVVFNPETHEQLSEALVNIEHKLSLATEKGIINNSEKNEILKVAKSIYYPKRTYSKILAKTKISEEKKENLIEFASKIVDIKTQDAIAVLEFIKSMKNSL
ncbi:MAG: TfuA-related McrA-glycine thioamidation protein [Methanobrevibacter sp.]|nr:TfuA-related McrA-glycine thioamidation protein [Methanobrevibacter sp.]